jgi:hypothetical protein
VKIDPLLVHYPGGGTLRLLHWWTDDERGHVILAKADAGIHAALRLKLEDHSDMQVRAYCEVEIVGPSAKLQSLHALYEVHERVYSFHGEVIAHLREVLKAGRPLPPPFTRCTTYESEDDSIGHDEWSRETHYGCRHCRESIRLVAMTSGQLYDRYHEGWRQLRPTSEPRDRKRVVSRAAPAIDDEPLWYACAEFGHHRSGIVLGEVAAVHRDEEYGRPSYLSDQLLFFFRRGPDLDRAAVDEMVGGAEAAAHARHAQYELERVTEFEERRRKDIEDTIRFFTSAAADAARL